jgi:hypothetical protein
MFLLALIGFYLTTCYKIRFEVSGVRFRVSGLKGVKTSYITTSLFNSAVKEFSAIQTVIPAKAGIQKIQYIVNWMPAFAGMTKKHPDPSVN